jgi:hypothetical protein
VRALESEVVGDEPHAFLETRLGGILERQLRFDGDKKRISRWNEKGHLEGALQVGATANLQVPPPASVCVLVHFRQSVYHKISFIAKKLVNVHTFCSRLEIYAMAKNTLALVWAIPCLNI